VIVAFYGRSSFVLANLRIKAALNSGQFLCELILPAVEKRLITAAGSCDEYGCGLPVLDLENSFRRAAFQCSAAGIVRLCSPLSRATYGKRRPRALSLAGINAAVPRDQAAFERCCQVMGVSLRGHVSFSAV